MEQYYPVTIRGTEVGNVSVLRQGLYYHISCRCHITGDIIYRLTVDCESGQKNLGILIPENGYFILNTKLPVKRIGEGDKSFKLVPKQEDIMYTFHPIIPEEPFAYLSRLKDSFLIIKDGQTGICISKMQEH